MNQTKNFGICRPNIIHMKKDLFSSQIFKRGVEEIIVPEELQNALKEGRQLRIKHGIDATSPDLHIGHAANLWKIREMQEAGHKAVILLGDFTTAIGDPTGKTKARPALSYAAIKENIASIQEQVKKILLTDSRYFEIRKSSEWYQKMHLGDFIEILSSVTHGRLIERDMFARRIAEGREIFMHELVYPILQGYDSVALRSDLTFIGSDQLFNEHMGRFLQEKFGQKPQVIITLKILPGLDGGEKMSKSLGNYIGLEESPRDKFGKAMRALDSLIIPYLECYTDAPEEKIEEIKKEIKNGKNPMEAKLFFAEALVRRYHGEKKAKDEREYFLRVFSKKELSGIASVKIKYGEYPVLELLTQLKLIKSKSEARRLLEQNAVEIDGATVSSGTVTLKKGTIIRVGKRRFLKVQ